MDEAQTTQWVERCLRLVRGAGVAVFGDFCLDAYWLLDPDESELSVETGLPVRRVRRQRYSPGGAGNIVANLAALGVPRVHAIGLVGGDPFGALLRRQLEELGADVTGMLDCQEDWQTMVYAKPVVGDEEQNRFDFGSFNVPTAATIDALAERLDAAAAACQAVVMNQQVPGGVSTPRMIERLNDIVSRHRDRVFLVDSRDRPELYDGNALKLNARELARLCGQPRPVLSEVPAREVAPLASRLSRERGERVFVTCGADGMLVAEPDALWHVPGIAPGGPIDPVGAGDTVTAALAAVLGTGGEALEAALLANVAASVVVRKLRTTGTASPDEVREQALRQGQPARI